MVQHSPNSKPKASIYPYLLKTQLFAIWRCIVQLTIWCGYILSCARAVGSPANPLTPDGPDNQTLLKNPHKHEHKTMTNTCINLKTGWAWHATIYSHKLKANCSLGKFFNRMYGSRQSVGPQDHFFCRNLTLVLKLKSNQFGITC